MCIGYSDEGVGMKSFISSMTLNTGITIPLNRNDIVVFVGPNNAGKSQHYLISMSYILEIEMDSNLKEYWLMTLRLVIQMLIALKNRRLMKDGLRETGRE